MDNEQVTEILTKLARIETKLDLIDDHEKRLRDLENKPAKRWDSITISVLSAIFVGIIGYIIGKLF